MINEFIDLGNHSWINYYPQFISESDASELISHLKQLPLKVNNIKLFGKTYATPREELFMTNSKQTYSYSGNQLKSVPFTPLIEDLKKFLVVCLHTSHIA